MGLWCADELSAVSKPGIREARFETFLVDLGLCPDERLGGFVIGVDEGIDVLPELIDRGERGAVQRLSLQNREPDLHLVEPGSPRRREVELHVRVTLEPPGHSWACGCSGCRGRRGWPCPD